ncbi:uncharacterized protein LOC113213318 [Frankliniella occidentalis]|uniref:DNA-directed DNA polymerase n=1 Tax=Frankliniella occidentalis TaxID=133901 RepID=A0A6J1T8X5_FRAOC|nr:uncharacterized protein LOC113213318 [Frankliniella occidentalis]
MSCVLTEVLEEWEGGCFYNDELLAQAYIEVLASLMDAPEAARADIRVIPFLLVGYQALLRVQGGGDRQSAVTYRMALAMVGQGSECASAATAAEPQPGPSRPATPRPPSPQPGPSKRRLEEEKEGEEEEDESPTLEVLQTEEREIKRFKTKFREEIMLVKGLGNTLPSEEVMEGLFDTVLQRQREAVDAKDDDRVIVEIENGESADNPLWLSLRKTSQLNGRVILDKLSRILNSNQTFMVDGKLKLSYIHIPSPKPGGRRINRIENETTEQWLTRKIDKKSIFSPDNTDNMCLTRSVAIAIARHGMNRKAFSRFKVATTGLQQENALKLCENAHIDPTQPCGIDEVVKLQDSLPDFRLCVFTDKNAACVYKGPYVAGRKNIYLLWHQEHFSAILYPGAAFDFHFECEKCVVFYNHKLDHHCEGYCWRCYGENQHEDALVRCPTCHHHFAGAECLEKHKTVKINNTQFTKCELFKFCNICKKSYSTLHTQKHMCGFIYCRNCKESVKENHLCYMSKWSEKEKKKDYKYVNIYWDTECSQDKPVEGKEDTYEHVPNLIVTQAVCDECKDITQNEYFCAVCKTRQQIFHNLDDPELNVMGQFIDYLRSFPAKTKLLLIAHNSRSYDGPLVLQELIARKIKVEPTLQGAKILCLTAGNWKFIDSLMFLPMPLSSMPKSFGLTELKKGYTPFLANKPEYYKYEGPLLDKDFYCVSNMKRGAAKEFNDWYDAQVAANYVFNFRRELIDYCISDVTILRQACQAFRKLFQEVGGFDPMFNCMTLSSACMAAFRRNFLAKDTIGIVPAGGYHGRGKQSHIALKWLSYEEHVLGRKIKTIYTDREVMVMGRPVDGYVELPLPDGTCERRIYQFHGCYWHNCPTHFPPTSDSPENRYVRTQYITAMYREAGYKVVVIWECEFKRRLESDPDVMEYFKTHPTTTTTALNLRDGLAGGRTSALRWYYKADLKNGEKIKLVDVVSEYPNANLRGEYPIGHPDIHLENSPEMPTPDLWNVYRLEDLDKDPIQGTFNEAELQKVTKPEAFKIAYIVRSKGKKGSRQHFVHWRGYPEKSRSWILDSDLV